MLKLLHSVSPSMARSALPLKGQTLSLLDSGVQKSDAKAEERDVLLQLTLTKAFVGFSVRRAIAPGI